MILLTGASGFIGNEILNQLIKKAYSPVRTYGRSEQTKLKRHNNYPVEHVVGEIGSNVNYGNALCGVDTVIHCAALAHAPKGYDDSYRNINFLGVIELANQARLAGVKRFVFISSIGVNGFSTKAVPFSVDSLVHPHNAYAQSKYDAETGLQKIAEVTGLEIVIVRPTLVYGANAPGNFGALTKLVNKLPFLPFGLANNLRDFIAVQNLADLLITCATHPNAGGHTFLASDGETVSIKEFTNAIAKGLNKKLIQLPVPVGLMRFAARLVGKSSMAEQLLGNLQVDSSNAKEVLGWTPPYSMEQAMASLSENKK